MKPKIDKKTLTIEQSTALEQYEQNQTLAKQLIQLKKLGDSIEGLVFFVKENETKQPKFQKEIGSLLVDIRESLTALTSKKTPEYPDYAKPVVEALKPLEKAIKAIDMKPQVTVEGAKIESPDVKVDLKGVEKIVKDIPKAFKDSIKLIPKPEKTDFKPLLKAWEGISEQLVSIETATRMKPLPGSIAINNFSDMTGGDASAANQVLQTALLTTIDADTGNIATEVAGLLTDTELRATPVPVSGTVTATPTGTQNVDVTANTIGLATSANQTNGNQIAVAKGDVASGSADSGNPVKVGAKYNSTQPTFTDGQRADMQVDSRGNLRMGLYANNTQTTASFKADNADADATSATANKLGVMSRGTVYNGTTWDRQLGDATNGTLVNLGANNDVTVTSGAITETNSAAIKTAVETIDNAIAGSEMQVDVVGALPAGTNAIGKLAANSGVDIGDVDVTSIAAGTNVIGGTYPTPSGVSAQALSNDTSTAYEASSVTKASAGTVYGVTGYNSKTSAQFFQFFNSTTVPADATAPVITIRVAALSNFSMDFGAYGRYFSTGIAWSNSSTGATKTIGSADMFVDVNYK